jgi:small-conductance mechanosensitive channel
LFDFGWPDLFDSPRLWSTLRALIVLIVGLIIARLISRSLQRALARQLSPQQTMLVGRASQWAVAALAVVAAARNIGFDLSVLLGAAGVLTVALGFASQTSASNFISGLFLIIERPFVIHDVLKIGDTTGEVIGIDLLSVKLRTFDNLLVRIPNEALLKSNIVNLTHFPIRRFDLKIGVAYKEDIERVREVLLKVATDNPICLEEPAPQFLLLGFGDSSIDIQFSVWSVRQNFLQLRNEMQLAIKRAFDEAGIEIPFPHRTLYTGAASDPFPIRIVNDSDAK